MRLRDDRGQLLERRAQRSALTGGLLEKNHRAPASPCVEQLEYCRGDERESLRFTTRRVTAGMEDDAQQAKRLRSIELVTHGVDRLPSKPRVRRRQVDQVARMRESPQSGRCQFLAELTNFLRRQHPAPPLVGVLGKDLKRFA